MRARHGVDDAKIVEFRRCHGAWSWGRSYHQPSAWASGCERTCLIIRHNPRRVVGVETVGHGCFDSSASEVPCVKRIGFLSFGHWTPAPDSEVRTASDALLQSIELAVAAEELGLDGAYFRVHHFARQLGSPFPLLAAVGARTSRIEIGTAVIDMRYENPMYMAEDAGAADIIAGGRLQLGISRGSPEQVIDGWRYFGYAPR